MMFLFCLFQQTGAGLHGDLGAPAPKPAAEASRREAGRVVIPCHLPVVNTVTGIQSRQTRATRHLAKVKHIVYRYRYGIHGLFWL